MFGALSRRRGLISASTSVYRGIAASNHINMAPQQKRKNSGLPEGYREDHAKGAMLRYEDSLPSLPVPSLEATSKRYLKSVHPLLTPAEYENTKMAVDAFVKPGAIGHTLQERLLQRSKDPKVKNWLSEWWNNAAYLGYRDPIVPYVSYFYSHRDDRKRRDPAKRAAAISTGVLEFAKQVNDGSLEPEYMKKLPMAMSSYYWMFNACRIPAKPADHPVKYNHEDHQHILVIRKNAFFKVPSHHNGQQLSTKELEHQFRRVYEMADKAPAVGVMTTENRDNWTEMRERLINSNAGNKATLEAIESASFVVCLDDATPITLHERSHQYWHGDGANRWFDKPVQMIVNDNGTSGFNGEHSMMDGTPTHRLNDTVMHWIFNEKLDFENPQLRSDIPDPMPIRFQLSGENYADVALATTHHVGLMSQHELRVEAFQGYGKGLMKKFKCSPDAYVQMVIQLGYFKFYGKSRPTYESAATRRFQEGRTETCRTVSDESVAFCNAMQHPLSTDAECRELFRKAISAHTEYITAASDGKGVDRHLFGLKKLLQNGEDTPEIFKDPAYAYSGNWYISSSQLSSEYYNGYGWSQVIDDGWGIAYMINENSVQFNIVSKNLGAERMAFFLNEAAQDIRAVMEAEASEKPKARL
ncbi:Carnitine O-acetyltransferase, mitochondrial [Fulvia fulva]|uniref:Carnitine O-acetyltransferase, mitochondrial n=1 Tax=Passalora fulva TaxID=5499 RepID=A0A9Q8L9N7_PASFU|nr:Carnitine O-acetyltransferase, mitochondrial [Fulvia fulva]KAK4631404.1 Carnitine O-acetyltransferase, mitochondrial [Fulvia fulva]KAK4632861.1 Carnitine O-acetyltransferase, mitochondrial [Fulvia fulva]UJO13331.1 Carnitine O-acetyltransferase, mitochondrial [Fulvia fulva]WPV11165.1 Carnitine O-acetyltransferase, mitochondrial [Fulvia fulva]WPV26512.1 Carnitine O-acetyltransferase, mitochondrial [Fulvia fulva]